MKNGLSTYIKVSRRTFLSGLALTASALYFGRRLFSATPLVGSDFSPNHRAGHLLRTGELLTRQPETAPASPSVIIVGGGVAGLSAGWWLKKNGFSDFEIWELEKTVGGNSRSGSNETSAYPWGAHYVPLPNDETKYVRALFEELNVITGYNAKREPIFNELYLCSDPQERLFYEGRWHESLIPASIPESDKLEVRRFFATMGDWKTKRGSDGKKAFSIPVDLSSQDETFLRLDRLSFSQWLDENRYQSKFLRWYVDYCCRDDYGQDSTQISAWAGVHYFAGRNPKSANSESQAVLTWPKGNGWLVDRLRESLKDHIKTERVAYQIKNSEGRAQVDAWDLNTKKALRFTPQEVVTATPRFVADRIVTELKGQSDKTKRLTYSPWLVANITLKKLPEGKGASLAWDNVSFYGRSLGYIVSTHQDLHPFPKKTVLTFYFPLDAEKPDTARMQAYHTKLEAWQRLAVQELEKIHKGISSDIESVDVCIWGHGMITPTVGFMWGDLRKEMARSLGHIHFAHSDMSGVSIFEEAQYHGVEAAERVLKSVSGGLRA